MMPHLEDIQLEVLLEAGYIGVLLVVALGLDGLGRVAHRRSEQFDTAGFRYHAVLDAWECPMGEQLLLVGVVHNDRRVARYRARSAACNRCPAKAMCTDSDTGRELERTIEDWPQSDITRFYRVLALILVVLATLIGTVGLVRNHEPAGLVVLGGGLLLAASVGQRMIRTVLDQR
jgi:hypothetical protein